MRSPRLALFGLLAATVVPSFQESARLVKLALPHALEATESVWLEVTLGPLPTGAEIKLETATGKTLGSVSPFGPQARKSGGTYVVPIPRDAVSKDTLSARILVAHGGSLRAPTEQEVPRVELRIRK